MTAVPEIEQLTAEISAGLPLERLTAAGELASRLRRRGDELLDQFVDDARAQGLSWTDIGGALGTTKQAAQQRFAALADRSGDQAPFGLTGAAGAVLRAAESEARTLGHHYIRPEHLVVGLLAEREEMAAIALTEVGADSRRRADRDRRATRARRSSAYRLAGRRSPDQATVRARARHRQVAGASTARAPSTSCSPPSRPSCTARPRRCSPRPAPTRRRYATTSSRTILKESPELAGSLSGGTRLARFRMRHV